MQEERTQRVNSRDRLEEFAHGHTGKLASQRKKELSRKPPSWVENEKFLSSAVHIDDVVPIDLKFNIRVYLKKTSEIQIYPQSCKESL